MNNCKKRLLYWTLTGVKTLSMALAVSAVVGSTCAFFLWSLDWVSAFRTSYPQILYLLPLAGIFIAWIYHFVGESAQGGNNLIIDQIHQPGAGVPRRMAPLILVTTVLTHWFGGSAGREGSAVQIGGSVASGFSKLFPFTSQERSTLLMAGVAAGFGAVFGTPLAGAVFAIEVLAVGQMRYNALVPCLIFSILADRICQAWGIGHTHYHVATFSQLGFSTDTVFWQGSVVLKVILASVAFGLASVLFAQLTHTIDRGFKRMVSWPLLRPAIGGCFVIALVYFLGRRDYLGLGVSSSDAGMVTIVSSFRSGGAESFSWLWKIIFTAVTLGSGFKGGEVTPLFFIGAALGNALAGPLGLPVDLLASLGFVAVFAGATNTPLACTIMGIELFGSGNILYIAIACFTAYIFSGHSRIYASQKIAAAKMPHTILKNHLAQFLKAPLKSFRKNS